MAVEVNRGLLQPMANKVHHSHGYLGLLGHKSDRLSGEEDNKLGIHLALLGGTITLVATTLPLCHSSALVFRDQLSDGFYPLAGVVLAILPQP